MFKLILDVIFKVAWGLKQVIPHLLDGLAWTVKALDNSLECR